MAENKSNFLLYKGHPLVRSGNTIYYGSLANSCVVMMQILTTKVVDDMQIADKILIQLLSTDETLSMQDRILKRSEKKGLYNAMDIASIWLTRGLSEK
ncbi:MAG: hypothetical protein IJN07_02895 [Clostridia bacterium]|nr:hypothetical protein [Clostridia bacterium]